MKLGIYGGTFNPPHTGHLTAARSALEALELDRLVLLPAAQPPHKVLPPGAPSAEQRLDMTAIAADALLLPGRVEASALELKRPGVSYTADTLRQLREQEPDAQLWLLMGADMFLSFQNWREPDVIARLAGICAFARTPDAPEQALCAQARRLERELGARVRLVHSPDIVDISSTRLRALLAAGEGREFLAPAVYGYIIRKGLYGVHYDRKRLPDRELRACSYSMIRAKRVPHVMGVEEEAVRLAERWGGDEGMARRAAILHDCTKYLELDDQLRLCRQYGVELDELEQQAVKLLHAKTGACIARDIFGEPDEVYQAIFWHTTAKADMTLLEKIIYIADYIEPNRDFEGVEELRRLAYEDLDRALLLGVETTIQEMRDRRLPIHTNTLRARDWLREHGTKTEE